MQRITEQAELNAMEPAALLSGGNCAGVRGQECNRSLILSHKHLLISSSSSDKLRQPVQCKAWPELNPQAGESSQSNNAWAQAWRALIVVAAAATGFFTPWQLAFNHTADLYSWSLPTNSIEAGLCGLFVISAFSNLPRAVYLEEDGAEAGQNWRRQFLRGPFMLDMLSAVPVDVLAVAAAGGPEAMDPTQLAYISLMRLLHMLRLVKVRSFSASLEYNLQLSLLWVTLTRNIAIVMYITHWAACGFYFVCRQYGFAADVLVGTEPDFFTHLNTGQQYIYSLWWSLFTLTTVDFGNPAPATMPTTIAASVRASANMLFNIGLGAYLLGTITLLVVKADERTGRYRDRSANLRQFSEMTSIPPHLQESMQDHLKLHFEHEEATEEQVLAAFPTALRRRILRHLYLEPLRAVYLFRGTRQKFLDALISVGRLELFMPAVEVLSEGDFVNDLHVVVSGTVEAFKYGSLASIDDEEMGSTAAMDNQLLSKRIVSAGEPFGEVAFFTEISQPETIKSQSVCRVMVVPRSSWEGLARSFGREARAVLCNLQSHVEQMSELESERFCIPAQGDQPAVCFPKKHSQRQQHDGGRSSNSSGADDSQEPGSSRLYSMGISSNFQTPKTLQKGSTTGDGSRLDVPPTSTAADIARIRRATQALLARQEEERTTQLLYAASRGSSSQVHQLLQQGFHPDSADYDRRTALHLACANGHTETVRVLLAAGADTSYRDNFGAQPLHEACRRGHDPLIDLLLRRGASLAPRDGKGSVSDASMLCTCVIECDLPLLRRYLRAGAPVDAWDYDRRTALHCSAAEGNLAMVRLLVEDGNADVDCRDRWDNTPLDEARRMAAKSVIAFLENCDREGGVSSCHLDMDDPIRPGCFYDPWPRQAASQQPQMREHNVTK
ncbi:hypothetical protein WJX84_010180 [Apatococcus fuscideae]|uniref:Cyclic nucleotide-binding domain-containing protein n=1 Tax=Apatococcus fuscideae TaxID=2026836 RepID=A0AAW1SMP5_9CHLO